MRVPSRILLDPEANTIYVVPALVVSFFAFAYSQIFGPILVLAFYCCWVPVLFIAPDIFVRGLSRVLPLLILPALAAVSTLWSDQASLTLRSAIQFGITVVSGLVAARLTTIPNLVLGGVISGLLILIYSFVTGDFAYDVVDGSYAFAGAFGSKNQFGYYAALAIIFAVAIIFVFRAGFGWKMLAAVTGAVGLFALYVSQSATSVLSLLAALSVIGGAAVVMKLPGVLRGGVILIVCCLLLVLLGVAVQLDVFESIFAAFGKDTTLTGRTYLWSEGITFGRDTAVRGIGYNAFWTHGRPLAEELWQEFYINSRMGFHFHNTLIEAFVGLGLVGVAVVGVLTLALIVMPLRVILNRDLVGSAIVSAGLALFFVPRSLVEIDFLTPHTAGAFLVPFLLLHMADQRAREKAGARGHLSWSSAAAAG